MRFSAGAAISTAALLLVGNPFGPVLAAREAVCDEKREGRAMIRGTAELRADDVIVKISNTLLRSIYDDYMGAHRILMPADEVVDIGNGTEGAPTEEIADSSSNGAEGAPAEEVVDSSNGTEAVPAEDVVDVSNGTEAAPAEEVVDNGNGTLGVPAEEVVDSGNGTLGVPAEEVVDSSNGTIGVPAKEVADSSNATIGVPAEEVADSSNATIGVPADEVVDIGNRTEGVPADEVVYSGNGTEVVPAEEVVDSGNWTEGPPAEEVVDSSNGTVGVPAEEVADISNATIGMPAEELADSSNATIGVPAEEVVDSSNETIGVPAEEAVDSSNGTEAAPAEEVEDSSNGTTEDVSNSQWGDFLVWRKESGISKLLVEVTAQGEGAEALLRPAFEAFGFESTGCSTYQCSGFLPIESFPGFEARPEVREVHPSVPMMAAAPKPKKSEAVTSLKVDLVQAADPCLTGAGLKICIISDSFNYKNGYAADVLAGELPYNVEVLQETPPGTTGTDEGRAMAEVIYDIVPGAQIYFQTGALGINPVATEIYKLAGMGCNVIVDDVFYPYQPMFQDDLITIAAEYAAVQKGIPYFTAAGNFGNDSWEDKFKEAYGISDSSGCKLHDFGSTSVITRQTIETLSKNVLIDFQWEDSYFTLNGSPGASREVYMRIYNGKGALKPIAVSPKKIGGDPSVLFDITFPGTYEIEIAFCKDDGRRPHMKWVAMSTQLNSIAKIVPPPAFSSTNWGHRNGRYTAAVGAADFIHTPVFNGVPRPKLESYSSRGGTPLLFDRNGIRLLSTEGEVRRQPRFVATDDVVTTFFGPLKDLPPNGPGNHFEGTSAAASNAAAVAIMMLQANPKLTPLQVYDILAETAVYMGPRSPIGIRRNLIAQYDRDSGAGYIDANAAVKRVKEGLKPPVKILPKATKNAKSTKAQKKPKLRKRA